MKVHEKPQVHIGRFFIATLPELAQLLNADLSQYDLDAGIDHAGVRLGNAVRRMAHAIKRGDPDAALLGYSLIMKDPHLPFGRILKSNLARALKQRVELLGQRERERLSGKTATLLSLPFCPREVEDYCRLIKKMGDHMANQVIAMSRPISGKSRTLLIYLGTPVAISDRAGISHGMQ